MEIIFLNALNGQIRQPISEFISKHAGKTSVFCFQEAYYGEGGLIELAKKLLPGYSLKFADKQLPDDEDFAQATFIHPDIIVEKHEVLFPSETDIGLGLVSHIRNGKELLALCNFHGLSIPGTKLDTPRRLEQSRKIIAWSKTLTTSNQIIGGDFNLDITTESVRLFADSGYENLIIKHGITNTRNKIGWDKYPGNPQYFADYTFVSQSIHVTGFTVPENEISDHLPMVLTIN